MFPEDSAPAFALFKFVQVSFLFEIYFIDVTIALTKTLYICKGIFILKAYRTSENKPDIDIFSHCQPLVASSTQVFSY